MAEDVYRYGVKVLWCHSYLVCCFFRVPFLVFAGKRFCTCFYAGGIVMCMHLGHQIHPHCHEFLDLFHNGPKDVSSGPFTQSRQELEERILIITIIMEFVNRI